MILQHGFLPFIVYRSHKSIGITQLVGLLGTSRASYIGNWLHLLFFQFVQQWCEDLPAYLQLVSTHKVTVSHSSSLFLPVIAPDDIQNESLVRLGQSEVILLIVCHIQFTSKWRGLNSRRLEVHLHIDGSVWLHAQHKFVPVRVVKQRTAHVFELDTDLSLRLIQTLSTLQIEWHSVPSRSVDLPTMYTAALPYNTVAAKVAVSESSGTVASLR